MATKNRIVSGYALLFGIEYQMGGYVERIHPTALDFADMTDIRLLRDHVPSLLLARNASATLKLMVDKTGLYFSASLPDTALGNETADLLERRDLSQCSWGFTTSDTDSKWTTQNGVPFRTIMRVEKIWDVSLTTYAANPSTKAWISEARSEERNSVPDIESYETILQHIENSNSMEHSMELKSVDYRAGAKVGGIQSGVHYECASHQVQNQARALILAKAKEVATGKKVDLDFDWKKDLAEKQAHIEAMKARHAKEYQEAGERMERERQAFLEREAAKKRPVSKEQTRYAIERTRHLVERERQQRTPKIITSW